MRLAVFFLARPFKKPLAGMMQRPFLKAERNIGFSATVSARALKVEGASFSVFFQKKGMRPQRMLVNSRSDPLA
jgi:hypothetical protein